MIPLDFTQPPFDVLSLAERQSIRKHTQIRYLAADERLTSDDLLYFYVVIKGQIEQTYADEFVAAYFGSNHSDHFHSNDWFDSRRTPKKATNTRSPSSSYDYRAVEDTLLLQIDGTAIDKISAQNHLVRQLLSDKLPEKLKALQQRQSTKSQKLSLSHSGYTAQQEVQQIMLQPVTDVSLLPVHIVEAASSLQQAAQVMTEAKMKHVLVRPLADKANNISDSPLGILTDADVCRAVSDRQDPATTPCQDYASFNLRTINADSEIGDALLTMTRYRIHRLPVLDDSGQVAGILGCKMWHERPIPHSAEAVSTGLSVSFVAGDVRASPGACRFSTPDSGPWTLNPNP